MSAQSNNDNFLGKIENRSRQWLISQFPTLTITSSMRIERIFFLRFLTFCCCLCANPYTSRFETVLAIKLSLTLSWTIN